MHFIIGIWIFSVIGIGLIALSETTVVDISGPLRATVGENVTFMWTSDRKILTAAWGIRSGNLADPQYIFVDDTEVPVINSALKDDLKKRLHYIGNLAAGQAWFNLSYATINDSNTYIGRIREEGFSTPNPYYVELRVDNVPTTTPPTTVTSTPEPTEKNITTTPTPTTPTTPTPATSKNYKVMLNGTCNITKDVQEYIKNQTTEVFSVLSDFYNVTVAVKKLSSVRFIINLNLWFNKTVNESTIETYVGILLDRINNTMSCHFSSTITAIYAPTPTPSLKPPPKVTCTTGVKVGCAIGLVIALVIIVVIAVVIYRKKKEKKDWATWEKALVVIGFIVAIVIIIVIIVVLVDKKCT